jgi:para-nitrobenzyl esterase
MSFSGKFLLRLGAAPCLLSITLFAGNVLAQTRVHVQEGTLEGTSAGEIASFKGIPFAAPPVGDMRWRPPVAAKSWTGVRPVKSFSLACKQDLVRDNLPWTEEFNPPGGDSEDCLYLNVWTPKIVAKGTAALPVYVFIHGGAFHQGSSSVAIYDGAPLAAQGVVVVTIQYRLGVFGFLTHPELTAESPNHASGNYALMDCQAALRWIKQNISTFGGDPSKVTIGGQSAGASAVHALLASPMSRGLLRAAIAESGSSVGRPMKSLTEGEKEGRAFASAKGATSLAALRALPAEKLLPAPTDPPARFGPVVDGWILPEDPNIATAAGRALNVPVLTGMTADEGSSSPGYGHSSVAQLQQQSKTYGANQVLFQTLYPFSNNATASEQSKSSARDRGLASMYLWASLATGLNRSPVYTFLWAHTLPWPKHPEFAAFHCSDVPYVLGNLKVLNRPFKPEDYALSTEASGWWANFVRTGNPNGSGQQAWLPFDASKPQTWEVDTNAHMRPLMRADRLAFWKTALSSSVTGEHAGRAGY